MKVFLIALALLVAVSGDTLEGGTHHGHHDNHHTDHGQHAEHEQHAQHADHHSAPAASPAFSLPQTHSAPAQSYSQPPPPAAPAQSYQQPLAPAQTYSQPLAPTSTYPTDQSNYYYYYPEVPKEKDLFTKIKDKFSSLFYSTGRSDLAGPDATTTIIIVAVVTVLLIVFGPTIVGLISLTGVMAKVNTWINTIISAATGTSRSLELNPEDVIFYANRVFEAINKEY